MPDSSIPHQRGAESVGVVTGLRPVQAGPSPATTHTTRSPGSSPIFIGDTIICFIEFPDTSSV
jgi:hypothetical protein